MVSEKDRAVSRMREVSERTEGFRGVEGVSEKDRGVSKRLEGSIQRNKNIGFQRGQKKTVGF